MAQRLEYCKKYWQEMEPKNKKPEISEYDQMLKDALSEFGE